MNVSRIIVGILFSTVFSSVTFGIASYIYTVNDHSSTTFGPASDWWIFSIIIGLIFGGIVGGLTSAFIIGLKMKLFTAVLLDGLINFLVVVFILISTTSAKNLSMKVSLYSLIPLGLINGAIASFFTSSRNLE